MEKIITYSAISLLALSACNGPVHGPISGRAAMQLEAQTLKADVAKRKLAGPEALKVEANGAESISLPITWRGGCPYVKARINGAAPSPVLVDTGASIGALEAKTAIRCKVTMLDPAVLPVSARGIAGEESMRAGFAELALGDWRMKNTPWLVRTRKMQFRATGAMFAEGFSVDILGMNPLSTVCSFLTVDYRNSRLTLGTTEAYRPETGSLPIPLVIVDRLPHVRLKCGSASWLALLDTGSSFGIEIPKSVAKQLDVERISVPVLNDYQIGIGGQLDVQKAGIRVTKLPELEGLGPVLRNQGVAIRPDRALIGSHFLKDYRVTVDFKRNLLYLDR